MRSFAPLVHQPLLLASLTLGAAGGTVLRQADVTGLWTTINDRDGKPEAVVEIREVNGEYVGTVRELLVPADRDDSICGKCSGDRHGARVIGLEILRHMHRNADGAFGGGEILDPENGKTYRATMKLADDGRKLIVRGFVGFSIFGRSETWIRRTSSVAAGDSSATAGRQHAAWLTKNEAIALSGACIRSRTTSRSLAAMVRSSPARSFSAETASYASDPADQRLTLERLTC